MERTFAIIKPDAVAKRAIGDIVHLIESRGFRIIGLKMLQINKEQAAVIAALVNPAHDHSFLPCVRGAQPSAHVRAS